MRNELNKFQKNVKKTFGFDLRIKDQRVLRPWH